MKLVIRSPTGSEISYHCKYSEAREFVYKFSKCIFVRVYESEEEPNTIIMQIKGDNHE